MAETKSPSVNPKESSAVSQKKSLSPQPTIEAQTASTSGGKSPTIPSRYHWVRENGRKKRQFILDCCNTTTSRVPQYDGVDDRNLADFFDRPVFKRQLQKLVLNRRGNYISSVHKVPMQTQHYRRRRLSTTNYVQNSRPCLYLIRVFTVSPASPH